MPCLVLQPAVPVYSRDGSMDQDDGTLRCLAANVRRIRTQLGWSQAALAEALGIAVRSVQAIEAAETDPSTTRLVAIARALRCSVGDLVRPAQFTKQGRGRPKRRAPAPTASVAVANPLAARGRSRTKPKRKAR
jgi:transcriptional regulator with XRE-family HTH domain